MITQAPLLNLALTGLLMGCSPQSAASNSEEQAAIAQMFYYNDMDKNGCLSEPEWRRIADAATDAIKGEATNTEQFRHSVLQVFIEMNSNRDKCISSFEYLESGRKSRISGVQAQ